MAPSKGPRTIDMTNVKPPLPPARTVITFLLIGVAAMALWSSFFRIEPSEVGVIVRFGKYAREVGPGPRFKIPYPIERLYRVAVEEQRKQEFGFETLEAGVRSRYSSRNFEDESLMLTGDLNVALIEWIAQYRITDPRSYLFNVRNVEETFRDLNEAVMRAVIGDRSVNEVLTIGRVEIAETMRDRLQELCDRYETGITVEQIVLQDVNPPDEVKPSFNEVNQAEQERERLINEAQKEYNSVIPRARGEAQQTIEQAQGYATDRVNRAQGDVALFQELQAAYQRAPEVTRRRIYLETMAAIYPEVKHKVLLDSQLKGVLPLLPLTEGGDK